MTHQELASDALIALGTVLNTLKGVVRSNQGGSLTPQAVGLIGTLGAAAKDLEDAMKAVAKIRDTSCPN